MSRDNNKLKLTINPKQQADDGSKIEADATAWIDNAGNISFPDPPADIVFELPKDNGAVFADTKTTTTSRKTNPETGQIEKPAHFYSHNPIDNGTLQAYWKNDKVNTLRKKSFTFTSLPGFIKPTDNFVPADGSSTITLQVGLLDKDQEATISFSEETGTVSFSPTSVQVQPGKTAITKATCTVPGAFFVRTEVGITEIDFIANGQLTPTYPGLSDDSADPTPLTLANEFEEVEGWFTKYYMLLPSFKDYTFSSILFDAVSWVIGDTVYFQTSDGSVVDPASNGISLQLYGTDFTPVQLYVGAFYSKEKNLWLLHDSGKPIFGLKDTD